MEHLIKLVDQVADWVVWYLVKIVVEAVGAHEVLQIFEVRRCALEHQIQRGRPVQEALLGLLLTRRLHGLIILNAAALLVAALARRLVLPQQCRLDVAVQAGREKLVGRGVARERIGLHVGGVAMVAQLHELPPVQVELNVSERHDVVSRLVPGFWIS